MSTAIADIVDVFAQAEQIKACDLRVGDVTFDVFGGTYRTVKIRRLKEHMKFWREGVEHPSWWELDATVTVIRQEGESA